MKKRIIIVSFIVISLVMGGAFAAREAGAWAHDCVVPYLVKGGAWGWNTGLHITGLYSTSEVFRIQIYDMNGSFKIVSLDLADHPGGWTGYTDDLLALPAYVAAGEDAPQAPAPTALAPVYPLRIHIWSTYDWFTVTQFVAHMYKAFGFQTHRSWPWTKDSPYEDPAVALSEPFPAAPGDADIDKAAFE